MSKKKSEKILTTVIYMGACCGVGALGGYAMSKVLPKNAPVWHEILSLLAVMVAFYIVVVLQTFIHEVGHMIGGLMSGYKFESIRFFCLMFVKENGKLRVRKYSVAGTGGQCCMIPPHTDGSSPVALFNWGGCLANVILSVISIVLAILCKDMVVFNTFFITLGIIGIAFAIINGIPLRTLSNDGYNAMTLKKRTEARKAFERSLVIAKEIADGKRLRDMPDEFFDYEIGKYDLEDNMLITTAVMTLNYHIDCGNYDKVYELSKYLYENVELTDMHKLVAVAELVTSVLVTGRDKSEVDTVLTKENKKLIKTFESLPSAHRVWYVYELLYNGDMEQAEKHKKDFDKRAEKYPYKTDLQNDIELMEAALKKFEVSVA